MKDVTPTPSFAGSAGTCQVTDGADLVHLRLSGSLCRADVAGLDRTAALALRGRREEIVVDLCAVDAIDTSIAAWLLRCQRWATDAGARLAVLTASGPVADLLDDSGVSERLMVLDGTA